jgi:DNA-binding beta-propeller fold protein YncE
MHILPQLRKLEEKYRDTLVVIGVHSAKFSTEKSTTNIAEAVARYNIGHPVVNDAEFTVWQQYGARAWPTLMFIDPQGKVIGKHEGEFAVGDLDRVFREMIAEFDSAGLLNRELLPFQQRAITASVRPLAYPGKIEFDSANERLAIADSNHHRVLVTSLEGEVQHVIGNGETAEYSVDPRGFEAPVFDNPQGMVFVDNTLYVADAGDHTIKRIDLSEKTVSVIAGTGEQALFRHDGGPALERPLNSPYDVGHSRGMLYIAMAGFHQLWDMNLFDGSVAPFAGTGGENIKDGTRLQALLAQPYGLAVQGNNVFFVDSETSSVRVAKLGQGGRVVTLVGTGLFDFGDSEGIGKEAKLQHVQGITVGVDELFIADTYNHRIKRISLATLRVSNVAGTGKRGNADGPLVKATFNEPAGLAFAGDRIYVADTNNHAIRVLDMQAGEVSTLQLTGL